MVHRVQEAVGKPGMNQEVKLRKRLRYQDMDLTTIHLHTPDHGKTKLLCFPIEARSPKSEAI